jgi:predicted RNA binding protein YcfA (HicA-like mRNA interferase family)
VISLAEVIVSGNEKVGFEQIRQKGSHKFFKHPDGRTATVPEHKGEDLGRGITNKILKDAEVTREDFLRWHQKQMNF